MLPLYGFLQGDSVGLLILVTPQTTVFELSEKLQAMARIRVPYREQVHVIHRGIILPPDTTLEQMGVEPLDRIDVRAGLG